MSFTPLRAVSTWPWGYVDQPPFSEVVLALSGRVLGYSLFALRFLPACAGAWRLSWWTDRA